MISAVQPVFQRFRMRHAAFAKCVFRFQVGQHLRVRAFIVAQPVIGVDPDAMGRVTWCGF